MSSGTLFSRLIVPLPLLFLLSSITFSQLVHPSAFNDSSPSLLCSSDSFICPGQGNCIPADWVGDGELDCEDGADEQQQQQQHSAAQEGENNNSSKSAKSNNRTRAVEDPFSLATSAPIPIQSFSQWIGQFQNEIGHLFARPLDSGHFLLQICPLLSVPANSSSSEDDEGGVGLLLSSWSPLQMYICELLGPAMRDHSECLASSPSGCQSLAAAVVAADSPSSSLACNFLLLSSAHFHCLEEKPSAGCSESALEMLTPLRQESEHWAEQLGCSQPQQSINPSPQNGSTTISTNNNNHNDNNNNNNNNNNNSSHDDKKEIEGEEKEKGEESQEMRETAQQQQQQNNTESNGPWDTLHSLANAKTYCSSGNGREEEEEEENAAEPIWSKICERIDVLTKNGDCLAKLEQKEGKKCNKSPPEGMNNITTCTLMAAFSHNLDCSLGALNELCPIEAQEAVMGIQEQLNDEAIARQCYQQQQQQNVEMDGGPTAEGPSTNGKAKDHNKNGSSSSKLNGPQLFMLRPMHGGCTEAQEENALLCIAELADLPGRLQRLPSMGSLFSNHSALSPVCAIFERYEECLQSRVFSTGISGSGARCALNSPLNALARIGLAPICANFSRIVSPKCLSPSQANCQAPIDALGHAVGAILQGVPNGEAHLCRAFYSLREAYKCGQKAARRECQGQEADAAAQRMDSLLAMLDSIGQEEGCPPQGDLANQLDRLLNNGPLPAPPPPHPSSIPLARPLPLPPSSSSVSACSQQFHDNFHLCVKSLGAFQPHPLSVIKQPKLIGDACLAFANFTECQSKLLAAFPAPQQCSPPLWARGMSGMFEFACGPVGNAHFLEVRQCLRRATARPDLRECVLAFSRASPQESCPSSRQLLACSLGPIEEKCGQRAGQFVREYVGRFASALDPNCSLSLNGPPPAASPTAKAISIGPNCSQQDVTILTNCSAPFGQLRAQLEGFFTGGLQTLLKNLNGLSSLFQTGCSLSSQFRHCVGPSILSPSSPCIISSCLMAAGTSICDQPDPSAAIDANLGCLFRQVSNPQFGQCIRAHFGPLRQLNLLALRASLPPFIECVGPIIRQQCGQVPLNILRVLASDGDECPLNGPQREEQQHNKVASPPIACTSALRESRRECQWNFLLSKYHFVPGFLLNVAIANRTTSSVPATAPATQVDQFCADLEALQKCELQTASCEREEPYGEARAMRALGIKICSSRGEFAQQAVCMERIGKMDEDGGMEECLAHFDDAIALQREGEGGGGQLLCAAINASSHCIGAKMVAKREEAEAEECASQNMLDFMFSASNEYLAQMVPGSKCQLDAPILSLLEIGCTEGQLIAYLECESAMDRFQPRPIAFISNQSKWDEFCGTAKSHFRPCVQNLECRPEPITRATLALHEMVCEREIARRDQRRFGPCFLSVIEQNAGQQCLDQFKQIDLLAKDSGPNVCAGVDQLLQCLAKMINLECGEEALLHIFDVYNVWTNAFHGDCTLSPPAANKDNIGIGIGTSKEKMEKPEVDFSADQIPLVINGTNKAGNGEEEEDDNDDNMIEWNDGNARQIENKKDGMESSNGTIKEVKEEDGRRTIEGQEENGQTNKMVIKETTTGTTRTTTMTTTTTTTSNSGTTRTPTIKTTGSAASSSVSRSCHWGRIIVTMVLMMMTTIAFIKLPLEIDY